MSDHTILKCIKNRGIYMKDIEKLGVFYLGKIFDPKKRKPTDEALMYDAKDLTTHAMCVGMTGSGKTGLAVALLEEAAIDGIPSIIIDPKGDMTNLLLAFPGLKPSDFQPWVDEAEAKRKNMSPAAYAESIAKTWKDGLTEWGESGERVGRYKNAVDMTIYTPASRAGVPLSILNSFSAPAPELIADASAFRDRVLSTTSSLLALLGIEADPIKSREHILISTILNQAWRNNDSLDLGNLIQLINKPPFEKVGVFDIETFFPSKDRLSLSMKLNNLIASPGFQAWMEGEPLDVQRLLYTEEGKPRLSVLYIAHLSDAERMFFVTLLLNEVISWMRRQSGTSSLRSILYMDEIFGFFPPTAVPPSKIPMLTLLKQARAFGLGIFLTTQNPVDLDYKGLSNCGTWFIGKLQTERDKARLLDGLKSASNSEMDSDAINKMLASCGNRVFIMHSVHEAEPVLFESRWALSYLRGPLTLPQIEKLTDQKGERPNYEVPETAGASLGKSIGTNGSQTTKEKPSAPVGVEEYFFVKSGLIDQLQYKPRVLGQAKLHFVDAKNQIDNWKDYIFVAPVSDDGNEVLWDEAESTPDIKKFLTKDKPKSATYETLPAGLIQSKNYSTFAKTLISYLYQNQTLDILQAPEYKLTSKDGESEGDFQARLNQVLRETRDEQVKNLRDRYNTKIATLTDKIKRAQDKADKKQSDVGRQKWDTIISAGTTILGGLFGRSKINRDTISRAGTTIRRASKIGEEQQVAFQAEESLKSLQEQLEQLQSEIEKQVADIQSGSDASKVKIEKLSIRPRKSDITVPNVSLVWIPIS